VVENANEMDLSEHEPGLRHAATDPILISSGSDLSFTVAAGDMHARVPRWSNETMEVRGNIFRFFSKH
jgi:hypothetical protein